jgi:hypothetical protein
MILIIKIEDLPPMPRNRSHMLTVSQKRPMNVKTPLCREYEKDLFSRMNEFKAPAASFKKAFDPHKHYISAEYYIFTPDSQLFTVDKRISAKAVDLDAHKVMQDTIFKYIDLDDKLVRDAKYFSPVSHDGKWNYVIVYRLENLCNLRNTSTSIQSLTPLMNDNSMSFALL